MYSLDWWRLSLNNWIKKNELWLRSEQLQNNCSGCFGETEGQMVKFCNRGRGCWAASALDPNCTVCTALHLPQKRRGPPRGPENDSYRVLRTASDGRGICWMFASVTPGRLLGCRPPRARPESMREVQVNSGEDGRRFPFVSRSTFAPEWLLDRRCLLMRRQEIILKCLLRHYASGLFCVVWFPHIF